MAVFPNGELHQRVGVLNTAAYQPVPNVMPSQQLFNRVAIGDSTGLRTQIIPVSHSNRWSVLRHLLLNRVASERMIPSMSLRLVPRLWRLTQVLVAPLQARRVRLARRLLEVEGRRRRVQVGVLVVAVQERSPSMDSVVERGIRVRRRVLLEALALILMLITLSVCNTFHSGGPVDAG
jgi:hypothetical protein